MHTTALQELARIEHSAQEQRGWRTLQVIARGSLLCQMSQSTEHWRHRQIHRILIRGRGSVINSITVLVGLGLGPIII